MRAIFVAVILLGAGMSWGGDPVALVNPFLGTKGGSCHPGATWPFGMVQPGPDVGDRVPGNCGYRPGWSALQGFSQNRVMGTFWACLHDVRLLPYEGREPRLAQMDKSTERAEPGYYAVTLRDSGIRAELTCSERVAYHRYTFPNGGESKILVDLAAGPASSWGGGRAKLPRILAATSSFGADGMLTGHNVVKCNFPDRDVFFAVAFSRQPVRVETLSPTEVGPLARRYAVVFNLKPGEHVVVKVALSSVDEAGARGNLAADPADFDFDARRKAASAAWRTVLSRVEVTAAPEREAVFATMLYQACVQPQRIDDVDGRVRIGKDKVITASHPFYTGFLDTWDTFRAAHPLYTLLFPKQAGDFAASLLDYTTPTEGHIPSNTVFGRAARVMPGDHGVPIVADAALKGLLPRYSSADLLSRMLRTTAHTSDLAKKGYYPLDKGCGQNVAAQLDAVVDAEAICRFARETGATHPDLVRAQRVALSWTNLYDRATGALRPRNSKGEFVGPDKTLDFFRQGLTRDERKAGVPWGFNEGGYAQWAWHVLGNPARLIALHGGPEQAAKDLDRIFLTPFPLPGQKLGYGCTGSVGQYFHGNEPTHHMAYYYQFMGRPDRTRQFVDEICTRLYRNSVDGLCGDGDSGQMGAWYVLSAFGFYSFDPVGGDYVLGSPQAQRIVIHLANGQTLRIARKTSGVGRVMFNGHEVKGVVLHHADLLKGGSLSYE